MSSHLDLPAISQLLIRTCDNLRMFTIQDVMCIRTGSKSQRAWIPIKTEMIGGRDCVKLNGTKNKWAVNALVQAKQGRDSGDAHLVLQAFEEDVRSRSEGADPGIADDSAASSQERVRSPKKQRLTDSDSEVEKQHEDSSQSPSERVNVKKGNKKKSLTEVGFMAMRINDNEFQVGFHKGPGLILPADLATLDCVINHLHAFYEPLLSAGRGIVTKIAKKKGTLIPKKKGTPELKNRIRYDIRRSAYIVWYEGADSTMHRVSKGLEVPHADVLGKPLDKQTYANVKKAMMKKAQEIWNKFDQSDTQRFLF